MFIKYFNIIYLIKTFESQVVFYGTSAHIYSLFKMLLLIIILCHIAGSFYVLLATFEYEFLGE